jgi:hypothetical protein
MIKKQPESTFKSAMWNRHIIITDWEKITTLGPEKSDRNRGVSVAFLRVENRLEAGSNLLQGRDYVG